MYSYRMKSYNCDQNFPVVIYLYESVCISFDVQFGHLDVVQMFMDNCTASEICEYLILDKHVILFKYYPSCMVRIKQLKSSHKNNEACLCKATYT